MLHTERKSKEWNTLKRRYAALACALTLCAALTLPAGAAGFTDVQSGAWYEAAVNEMVADGIMTGVSSTQFSPDGKVTRATVAVVMWRMEGEPQPSTLGSFPDVADTAWYAAAAQWAHDTGIIKGTDQGLFNGDGALTRQELAVMLTRYDQYRGTTNLAQGVLDLFEDGDTVASWAQEGMAHAVGMGWLEGSDDKLNPGATTTRAELAVILQRLNIKAMG